MGGLLLCERKELLTYLILWTREKKRFPHSKKGARVSDLGSSDRPELQASHSNRRSVEPSWVGWVPFHRRLPPPPNHKFSGKTSLRTQGSRLSPCLSSLESKYQRDRCVLILFLPSRRRPSPTQPRPPSTSMLLASLRLEKKKKTRADLTHPSLFGERKRERFGDGCGEML